MKTTKLIVDYEFDFDVLGLVSSAKEYKLAWFLNRELDISLVKQRDLDFEFSNGKQLISNYSYQTDYFCLSLLKNKATEFTNVNSPYLLPELKGYDYILKLEGEIKLDNVKGALRNVSCIDYVNVFEVDNIKSKENLIF